MSEQFSIKSPHLLQLKDEQGRLYHGAKQTWYEEIHQRRAGCGPTTASHLVWYLSRTRDDCKNLAPQGDNTKKTFLSLMQEMWKFVTPGMMGVNSTELFTEGASKYSLERDVPLTARVLPVPPLCQRPTKEHLSSFLCEALSSDLPVAFLNLSNGKLTNLDNWHWVTLVAFNSETLSATMYDDGNSMEIDMRLWLKTTLLGGGLVVIDKEI